MHWSGRVRLCYVNEKTPNLNDLTPAKLFPLLVQFSLHKSIGRVCTPLSLRDSLRLTEALSYHVLPTVSTAVGNECGKSHSGLKVSVHAWLTSLLLMFHFAKQVAYTYLN